MRSEEKIKKPKQGVSAESEGYVTKRKRLIAASLITLVTASALLLGAALLEIRYSTSHLYTFGDEKQRIDNDLVYIGDEQMIDMNLLADFLEIKASPFFSQAIYDINGTRAVFENGSSTATVNGITVEMPQSAHISDGLCLIPISTARSLISGVDISAGERGTLITRDEQSAVFITVKEPSITYTTDMSGYLEYIRSDDEYIFLLANKQNPLGKTEPSGLIQIPDRYKASGRYYLMYSVAEKALEGMMNDMFALGYDDVYVTSAYRSYEYQEMLFEGYIDTEMKQNGLTYDEARKKVLTYSSEPGKSEHQTGLCIDFTTSSIGGVVDDIFATTSVFSWLRENSWKYGFIMRYPEDKTNITGYAYESWHYRFVGLEAASIMHQTGLCYEEYLEYFNKGE